MRFGQYDIGVCSWSLPGVAADLGQLGQRLAELKMRHLHLALEPLLRGGAARAVVERMLADGIILTAGMMSFPGEDYSSINMIRRTGGFAPDDFWPARRQLFLEAVKLASELGIARLSTHAGFIPPSGDGKYKTMLQRVRDMAEACAAAKIDLLLESGQETASHLLQFLNDVGGRNVQVNFDPANMILYGSGDAIDGVLTLGRHISHLHVKDARLSQQPGVLWGEEVSFGRGDVDPAALLAALQKVEYTGPLVFECEIPGTDRMAAIREGLQSLTDVLGRS